MTDADQLAEAARKSFESCCSDDVAPCEICLACLNALAAYDAGRAVREAEREYLELCYQWAAHCAVEEKATDGFDYGAHHMKQHTIEVDKWRAFDKLLAARKAKEGKP